MSEISQLPQRLRSKANQLIDIAIDKGFITLEEVLEVFAKPEKYLEAVDDFFDQIL